MQLNKIKAKCFELMADNLCRENPSNGALFVQNVSSDYTDISVIFISTLRHQFIKKVNQAKSFQISNAA